ncbi:hypothetical protein TcCL_NonESM01693 [Trypanosoma cruzi]|nr:hypothetical protein TcCL_NonESM01693 [Trypanosoma cruzi]
MRVHDNRRRAHPLGFQCRKSKRASVPTCCSTHSCASVVLPRVSPNKSYCPHRGNTCTQNSKCCNLLWHDTGGPDAFRCRQPCANNDPVRETLLAPGFSRQYGAIGPGATVRQSSMKSQGEATMTRAKGSHSTLN